MAADEVAMDVPSMVPIVHLTTNNSDHRSHKGKKLHKYSLDVKMEAIKYAEIHGNRPASRHFKVDERRIREWKSKRSQIEASVAINGGKEKNKLAGGGRKPISTELEGLLVEWIENRRAQGLPLSYKLIMKEAGITYRELTGDEGDFKASRGWLNGFMKRNNLFLRKNPSVTKKNPVEVDSNKTIVVCYSSETTVEETHL